jgi:ABC-type phosphate transport system substrate-binding protein
MRCSITFLCILSFSLCDFQGSLLYNDLISQWIFPYKIASGIKVNYTIDEDKNITDNFQLLASGNIDWTEVRQQPGLFVVPITGFPIAVAYRLDALGNNTLHLTLNLIKRMIADPILTWNDPEIVKFNPTLATHGAGVRMVFDSSINDINKYLINYFFENQTSNPGSWVGIRASRNTGVNSFVKVVSTISVLTNSLALVPYPYVTRDQSGDVKTSVVLSLISDITYTNYTILNSTDVGNETLNETIYITNENITYVNVSLGSTAYLNFLSPDGFILEADVNSFGLYWPLKQVIYVSFENNYHDCSEATLLLRFLYWVLNNTDLSSITPKSGYFDINVIQKQIVMDFLKKATCSSGGDENVILSYTNLSMRKRSNAVFAISIIVTIVLAGIVFYAYYLTQKSETSMKPKEKNTVLIVFHLMVLFGLLSLLISFVLYWYPPFSDGICIARYWTLSVGYINIVSSIFVWGITIYYYYSYYSSKRDSIPDAIKKVYIFLAYFALNAINLAILFAWTFSGNPRSVEVTVDVFNWETIYDCKLDTNIPDFVRSGYYFLVSSVGLWFIFRLWAFTGANKSPSEEKETKRVSPKTPDDMRFLLVGLYNQILVFIQILILNFFNLTDSEEYTILIPLFTFSAVNVVFSLFLQRIVKKTKRREKSSSTQLGDISRKVSLPNYDEA